jgi:hypothetical protein
MKMLNTIFVLGALPLALQACHSPSTPDRQEDAVSDATLDTSLSDASDAADAMDGPDADASPSDADASGDGDASGAEDAQPLEFDASLWMQPNPCQGETSFPEDNAEFFIPDRAPGYAPKLTRQELIADMGGMPLQATSLRVGRHLEPGDQRAFELFANPDTDVTLYLYAVNNYEDLSSFRLNVVVMVDYEPVEASYVRWSPDRTQKLMEVETTGLNFPITSDVEIVDITIPGSVFPEERMYEVSLSMETSTIERRPVGRSQRFALFNGGYNRPSRPCVEPRLGERSTSIERQVEPRISDDVAALFFDGIIEGADVDQLNDVRPGETRRMYLSVIRSDADSKPTVLVPLLDGKPLDEKWWVTQGGTREYERQMTIDGRKSFEVTFPEEPGIYEVQVASWTDPFELHRTREGEEVEGISDGGGLLENSNALRFRVVDAP